MDLDQQLRRQEAPGKKAWRFFISICPSLIDENLNRPG
jgi:hypothetical protein